jgi:hypothetical protein
MGRGHGAGGMAQGAAAGGMAQGAGRRGHSAWSMAQSVDGKPRTEVRWRTTDFLKSEGGKKRRWEDEKVKLEAVQAIGWADTCVWGRSRMRRLKPLSSITESERFIFTGTKHGRG